MAASLLQVRRLECGEGKSLVPELGFLSRGLSFGKRMGVSGLLAPQPLQNGTLAVCHVCQLASPWYGCTVAGDWCYGGRTERAIPGTRDSEVRPTRS